MEIEKLILMRLIGCLLKAGVMKEIQKSLENVVIQIFMVIIMKLLLQFRLSDWEKPKVDIIPLFETISDLKNSSKIIELLFLNKTYSSHLNKEIINKP